MDKINRFYIPDEGLKLLNLCNLLWQSYRLEFPITKKQPTNNFTNQFALIVKSIEEIGHKLYTYKVKEDDTFA